MDIFVGVLFAIVIGVAVWAHWSETHNVEEDDNKENAADDK